MSCMNLCSLEITDSCTAFKCSKDGVTVAKYRDGVHGMSLICIGKDEFDSVVVGTEHFTIGVHSLFYMRQRRAKQEHACAGIQVSESEYRLLSLERYWNPKFKCEEIAIYGGLALPGDDAPRAFKTAVKSRDNGQTWKGYDFCNWHEAPWQVDPLRYSMGYLFLMDGTYTMALFPSDNSACKPISWAFDDSQLFANEQGNIRQIDLGGNFSRVQVSRRYSTQAQSPEFRTKVTCWKTPMFARSPRENFLFDEFMLCSEDGESLSRVSFPKNGGVHLSEVTRIPATARKAA